MYVLMADEVNLENSYQEYINKLDARINELVSERDNIRAAIRLSKTDLSVEITENLITSIQGRIDKNLKEVEQSAAPSTGSTGR
jgi:hypothetical protein